MWNTKPKVKSCITMNFKTISTLQQIKSKHNFAHSAHDMFKTLIDKIKLKNVWMSDESWEPGMSECLNVLNNFDSFVMLSTYHMPNVKCLFWSLLHDEQLLFSFLCSKVTDYTLIIHFLSSGGDMSPSHDCLLYTSDAADE